MKNKWILFGVAIALIVINLLNADFSANQQLSVADFLPVIAITLVSFLIKQVFCPRCLSASKSYANG